MPFSDGQHTLMGGIGAELVQALCDRGFLNPTISTDIWKKGQRRSVPLSGERSKLIMDELVENAGVEVRFFTSLIDVVPGDRGKTPLSTRRIEVHR